MSANNTHKLVVNAKKINRVKLIIDMNNIADKLTWLSNSIKEDINEKKSNLSIYNSLDSITCELFVTSALLRYNINK